MPKATASKKQLNVAVETFMSAPGILGWADLVEPDDKFPPPKFKADLHLDDDRQVLFAKLIDEKVVEPLWDKFLKEAEKGDHPVPKKGWEKPTGEAWIEEHLKQPTSEKGLQVPHIKFDNAADFMKDGELKRKTMRLVGLQADGTNVLLDRRTGVPGRGSTVKLILRASLWAGPFSKGQCAIALKLQGVQVLKMEQYKGGAGGGLEDLSEDDLEALGEGFQADDFSGYAYDKVKTNSEEPRKGRPVVDDLDGEDIPF
jgi:hypothetical protein